MAILDSVFNKKNNEKGIDTTKAKQIEDTNSSFKSGVQFFNDGNYEKAEMEFRQVLNLNLIHGEAHYYLGKIYECKIESEDDFETMEKAMSEYQEVIKIDPNHIGAHVSLGKLYVRSGFYEGAIRVLEEALRINPNFGEVHAAMGEALYTIGTGREVKIEHPSGMGSTSDFRGAKEYYKKAIEEFDQAVKLEPALAQKLQPLIEKASRKT